MSALKGKATKGGGDFALCPAGTHSGVLIGVIDLGTHWESYQGQKERKVRRVLLAWEVECEVDGKDQRRVIGRDYNIGLNDKGELVYSQKSALRQLLEGWRGQQFGEGEDIDPEAPLGHACLVQVSHEKTGSGKEVARVKSCSRLLKGMRPLKPTYAKISYAADSENQPAPSDDWLPRVYGDTVATVLERCLEWGGDGRRKGGDSGSGNGNGHSQEQNGHSQGTEEPEPDEIPF